MPRQVKLNSLDALVGVTFGQYAFANMATTAISGSITNTAGSPTEVLTYGGLNATVGSVFLPMAAATFKVVSVVDASDQVTIDAFVSGRLVGEMNFTVAGFNAEGIALAAMPLDALVSQSGNLPGLAGAVFTLGLNIGSAANQSIGFTPGAAYNFIAGAHVQYATTNNPILHLGTGPQMVFGQSGNETIVAGSGMTIIYGGPGTNILTAGSGQDTIFGTTGTDTIYGGSGKDVLHAGSGTDTLIAGTGHTVAIGGSGTDSFVFSPGHTGGLTATTADIIQQFVHANGDTINLSGFDALLPAGGTGHLAFIGQAAFDNHPGEVRYDVTSTGITLWGDINGDGHADFSITLTQITNLAAVDFIL